MDVKTFEINGVEYKMTKLDAIRQFHIAVRIGPILADILPALKDAGGKNVADQSQEEQLDTAAKFIAPLMSGLSKLSESDLDKTLFGLLAKVEMKDQFGAWINLVLNGNQFRVPLDLPTLIQIAGQSFMFNLAGFFSARPQSS